jgi:hypothetical protein
VLGIRTTIPFFLWLMREPDFLAGRVRHDLSRSPARVAARRVVQRIHRRGRAADRDRGGARRDGAAPARIGGARETAAQRVDSAGANATPYVDTERSEIDGQRHAGGSVLDRACRRPTAVPRDRVDGDAHASSRRGATAATACRCSFRNETHARRAVRSRPGSERAGELLAYLGGRTAAVAVNAPPHRPGAADGRRRRSTASRRSSLPCPDASSACSSRRATSRGAASRSSSSRR